VAILYIQNELSFMDSFLTVAASNVAAGRCQRYGGGRFVGAKAHFDVFCHPEVRSRALGVDACGFPEMETMPYRYLAVLAYKLQ
jgi:hypothetical protein